MNRNDSRKIAETITNKQILEMFAEAKIRVKDWNKVSLVNKGMTKGVGWNILAKDFDINYVYHIIAKTNMIREFGKFLPDELKIKKNKKLNPNPTHQDPIFN